MEKTLHDRMKRVCDQSLQQLELDAARCQGLEQLVLQQIVSLADVPIAKEIHAGWYYVSALHTQAKGIKAAVERIKDMTNTTTSNELSFINNVRGVVTSKNPLTSIRNLAQQQLMAPTLFKEVADCAREVFARLGHQATSLSVSEQLLPAMVFSKTFRSTNETSELIKSYLMKGFVKYLHFPDSNERSVDPQI